MCLNSCLGHDLVYVGHLILILFVKYNTTGVPPCWVSKQAWSSMTRCMCSKTLECCMWLVSRIGYRVAVHDGHGDCCDCCEDEQDWPPHHLDDSQWLLLASQWFVRMTATSCLLLPASPGQQQPPHPPDQAQPWPSRSSSSQPPALGRPACLLNQTSARRRRWTRGGGKEIAVAFQEDPLRPSADTAAHKCQWTGHVSSRQKEDDLSQVGKLIFTALHFNTPKEPQNQM